MCVSCTTRAKLDDRAQQRRVGHAEWSKDQKSLQMPREGGKVGGREDGKGFVRQFSDVPGSHGNPSGFGEQGRQLHLAACCSAKCPAQPGLMTSNPHCDEVLRDSHAQKFREVFTF